MSEQTPPPNQQSTFDDQRWLHELKRRDAERAHDQENEFFVAANKATSDAGQAVLRTSILVNGGAAVSMLAFIGHLITEDKIKTEHLKDVTSSLIWFAVGVACALASLGAVYFANYATAGLTLTKTRKWEHPYITDGPKTGRWTYAATIFQIVAVLLGLASIVLFVVGMFDVRNSIIRIFG